MNMECCNRFLPLSSPKFDQAFLIKLFSTFIFLMILSSCKEPLFTSLSEEDANEMMAILLSNGISTDKVADKKDKSLSLHIEKSQLPTALTLLKQQGFPRESFTKVTELFDQKGLISSPVEERVRYIYALKQEVQETLSRIDGVVTARVHIVLPENNPFNEDVKPSSASVFIKSLADSNLDDFKSEIKFIVEKSIEGLTYDKISVVILPANKAMGSSIASAAWTSVLGVRVPTESASAFRFIIGLFAVFLLVMLVIIGLLLKKISDKNQAAVNSKNNAPPVRPTDNGSE
ncbi:MAG: type III secretion system inner membrane ring lipoprotein SctJ [Gammaproteobacteria bacterium]